MSEPFWKTKALSEMTTAEWESLCDGCGRCCLVKLEDEDTGRIHFTSLTCKLLNRTTCRCSDYANRTKRVPDCVQLTPENVDKLNWLPDSCAYRKLARGESLAWWHPLVSTVPLRHMRAAATDISRIDIPPWEMAGLAASHFTFEGPDTQATE